MYLKIIMLHNPICRSVDPQSSKAWMGSRRASVPYRDYTWRETKLNKRILLRIRKKYHKKNQPE